MSPEIPEEVEDDGMPRNVDLNYVGAVELLEESGEEDAVEELEKQKDFTVTLLEGYWTGEVRYLVRQDGESLAYAGFPDSYLDGE